MALNTLSIGDVVRLRSGGPAMVLFRLGQRSDGVDVGFCTWIDEHGRGREYSFPLLALMPN